MQLLKEEPRDIARKGIIYDAYREEQNFLRLIRLLNVHTNKSLPSFLHFLCSSHDEPKKYILFPAAYNTLRYIVRDHLTQITFQYKNPDAHFSLEYNVDNWS